MDLTAIHPVNFYNNKVLQNCDIGNVDLYPMIEEINCIRSNIGGNIEDTLSGTSGQFAISSDMITGFTAVYETIELSAYDDTELRTRINGIDDTLSGTSGQFALKNDLNSYLSAETDPIFKAESGNFALTSTITTINERLNTIDAILSSDFSDVVDMLDELQQKLDNLS